MCTAPEAVGANEEELGAADYLTFHVFVCTAPETVGADEKEPGAAAAGA